MYRLLLEPSYADSVWCKQIVQGLTGELKKRREEYVIAGEPHASDTVFVIGTQPDWLSSAIGQCNRLGLVPVLLCNSLRRIPGGRYHCVCSDISGSMRQLTASLKQTHSGPIALYGINPDSVGDRSRAEAFMLECPDPGCVFENQGSLADCYARFAPRREEFSAVICANGFAAISLYRRLRQEGSVIPLISCAQTLLGRYYEGRITSVDVNYGQFGKTALGIADLARKQPQISELTATVQWSLPQMDLCPIPALQSLPARPVNFYNDSELQKMLKLEDLLIACDELDLSLLTMLMDGCSYADMAQACYLTEGAVKYRVRKMRQLCDTEEKDALSALLQDYLQPK